MKRSYTDLALRTCTIMGGLFLIAGIASVLFSGDISSAPIVFGVSFLAAGALLLVVAIFAVNRHNVAIRAEIEDLTGQVSALSLGEPISSGNKYQSDESLIGISQYLDRIADAAKRVRTGDLAFDIPLRSQNDSTSIEFNRMLAALKDRVENIDGLEQKRVELNNLSKVFLELASGKGSTSDPPNAASTVELSAAIRSLTDRLRAAKDAGNRASSGMSSATKSAAKLILHINDHSTISERTSGSVVGLSRQAAALLETVRITASVIDECVRHGRFALDASNESAATLRSIRNQVQESVKRTKRLGERSQELSRIVVEFQDLADRASMLSLNASLQAPRPGSRADVSAISAEVEHLANRTSKLTDQISHITQAIALETKEASGSMEGIIRDVIVGSSLAERSDRSVSEIESGLTKLNDAMISLSDSASSQANSAAELSRSLTNGVETADAIQDGSRSLTEAVDSLSTAIAQVCDALDHFNLPPVSSSASAKAVESSNFVN